MKNKIKLLRNYYKKDWSDIEWVREFYEFLQGNEPEKIKSKQPLKLTKDEAFSVIWYLQEHFSIFPDTFEKCDNCGEIFDNASEGIYSEEGNEIGHHFCGNCDHLAPYNYDKSE